MNVSWVLQILPFFFILAAEGRVGGEDGFKVECEAFTTPVVCDYIEGEAEERGMSPLVLFKSIVGGR